MALPCFCYKCARCISQESLKDAYCLSVEKNNCKEKYCYNCDFSCERFTEKTDGKRSLRNLCFLEV
ncbi:MAG: hypothetical protein ACOY30_00405 [Bacillota bacterium]